MKRSEINDAIKFAKRVLENHHFMLPPFAFYDLSDWEQLDIVKNKDVFDGLLGWDVTDLATGDFENIGLTLFTIRNKTDENKKPYAEKIMVSREGQVTPMHYHWHKMEDIINRGGGELEVILYNRDIESDLLDEVNDVVVKVDSTEVTLAPGEPLILKPGQSICIPPCIYHSFYPRAGAGYVFAGEVSMANDDKHDNRFLQPLGRFTDIEEDEAPITLLCSDYENYLIKGN
ncbi:D-lyxose/D-mannose family sugar isomerase [Aeromonas jandaei]